MRCAVCQHCASEQRLSHNRKSRSIHKGHVPSESEVAERNNGAGRGLKVAVVGCTPDVSEQEEISSDSERQVA